MPINRRDFWGIAVGLDHAGKEERVSAFRTGDGYDLVNDRLYRHHIPATRKQTPEQLKAEVAAVFGLTDIRFEFPHLGIYAPPQPKAANSGLARRGQRPRFLSR